MTNSAPLIPMTPSQVEDTIRELAGVTIFSVTFTKRTDGSVRHMVCRLRVHKGITGNGSRYEPSDRGLLPVYDMQAHGWRSIPLDAIRTITIRGETYHINPIAQQEAQHDHS